MSREVVQEMACNLILNEDLKNQISIATTGVAGPDKSKNKPVGLVWIASYKHDNLMVKELNLGNIGREKIRKLTVFESLKLLYENLNL